MNGRVFLFCMIILLSVGIPAQAVNIGLNYPKTGPYSAQGLAQFRAAELAMEEINIAGGIMGQPINLITTDSQSKAYESMRNVERLYDNEKCEMVFGGISSSVAIESGKVAKSRNKIFFGTMTYSNATTGKEGHKYIFRESKNAWMAAKVLGKYLKLNYPDKTFFYVTADYSWGWSTEASIRNFTDTDDKRKHKRSYIPFPGSTDADIAEALNKAKEARADVLILVLFGKDMARGLVMAHNQGLKNTMAVVVPALDLESAQSTGPEYLEDVVGAVPWCWKIPYVYGYEKGKNFVKNFAARYNSYPSIAGACAYTVLNEYKNAVERAKTFDTKTVINALEGHRYVSLKDEQYWRDFDHQSVQTVYVVKCKPANQVLQDKFKQDFFEVIDEMSGDEAARTREEWKQDRREAGKPEYLEW